MEKTLIDAGCDAISCTAPTGTAAGQVMQALYLEQFPKEREAGNDVHNIAPSGYRGDQCGSVFLGNRSEHLLYQARGEAAKSACDRLADAGTGAHITRLDWQATFRPACTEAEAVRRYRRFIDATITRRGQKPPGRGVVHQTGDMANSYNLISSSGQSYWRTYNKSRESPGIYPHNTWRHEWQIKGNRALQSWTQFCESRDQAGHALGTLRGYLLKCGLDEPCLRESAPLDVTHGKHKSDTQRRLDWMESTVASVVGKLLIDGVSMEEIVSILTKANKINGWYFERGTLEKS